MTTSAVKNLTTGITKGKEMQLKFKTFKGTPKMNLIMDMLVFTSFPKFHFGLCCKRK